MPDQCDNCKFYKPRVYGTATVYECRYADPIAVGGSGIWPTVKPDDWCGKWVTVVVQAMGRGILEDRP